MKIFVSLKDIIELTLLGMVLLILAIYFIAGLIGNWKAQKDKRKG